ncbi:MAG: hypothetical protein WKF64_13105 [Ilumatobacteraceae bacterium]
MKALVKLAGSGTSSSAAVALPPPTSTAMVTAPAAPAFFANDTDMWFLLVV